MKIMEYSPGNEKSSALDDFSNRFDSLLKEVPFGRKEGKALQAMIAQMERTLSNKFFLLRNAPFAGLEKTDSLILVGPPGIYLLNANAKKGIYRAKDETWSEMTGRNRQFEPVQPNLIKDTLQLSSCLGDFLAERLPQVPTITPLLIFPNPGTHVDTVRPAVRIIMMDGLERFISRLSIESPQLTNEEVQAIVTRIMQPPLDAHQSEESTHLADKSRLELQALKPVLALEPAVTKNITSLSDKLHFSPRQWIFLGVIAAVNIILLITFLIIILLNT
jgi:hypothetical protein